MKVLLIGLDGMTFDIARPLMDAGEMAALATLERRGVGATLMSTYPPISAPAWVTFLTGNNPGRHGLFNFQNFDLSRYSGWSETLANSSYIRGKTLLDHAGAAGRRILSYRLPITYPPWPVNGVMVSGQPVPDRRRAYVTPAEETSRLPALSLLSHDELTRVKKAGDLAAIERNNAYELQVMDQITRRAIGDGTDLIVTLTGIPDGLHHSFWYLHDPASPVHDPTASAHDRGIIRRWYVEIDRMIGGWLGALGDDWAVIVLSDHGGGPAPTRYLNLNYLLAERGYLKRTSRSRVRIENVVARQADATRRWLGGKKVWLKNHLPAALLAQLRQRLNGTGRIDWGATRAYAVPIYFPVTGINLNVRGRQPQGVVAAGVEYERVRAEIMAAVAALCDPATGAPVCHRVLRKEEVHSGPHLHNVPDILLVMADGIDGGHDVDRLFSPVPEATLRTLSGTHKMEGIFIAAGTPFQSATRLESPVGLADILPTALYLAGVALPDDIDGRVMTPALTPAFLAEHPIVTTSARPTDGDDGNALSVGEEREMRKFLQDLGYIE
jgi:predicted AlkP superfamily phosphohydrolase/phosphomutase